MNTEEMLCRVAARLRPLKWKKVYIGGAVTPRLITDPAAPKPTATTDVDLIVDIKSRATYLATLHEALRSLGAKEDTSEEAPPCRWIVDSVKTDIMPPTSDALGFANRWYTPAIAAAVRDDINGVSFLRADAPHFIASKIEAFQNRGKRDFLASKDMEDIIAVVDGRPELASEVARADAELRCFVALTAADWLTLSALEYAVEGYLTEEVDRTEMVLKRLRALAELR